MDLTTERCPTAITLPGTAQQIAWEENLQMGWSLSVLSMLKSQENPLLVAEPAKVLSSF